MNERRTHQVFLSTDDGEWVGSCTEFPSLSHFDVSADPALRGIKELVDSVMADMQAVGEVA